MDDEEIFTASFPAGRKQIFVDVKENNIGKYLKIKERGDSQTNSILIPGGSIVQLRNALDEAVQALGLDSGKGGGGGKRVAGNQCVCHVGNLSWETTGDTLRELFSGYGEVVKAEVQMSRAGRSQGWGLVEFASAAEVKYAIEQCDGLDFDGREIRVRADKGRVTKAAAPAKTQRNDADKVVDPTKIFVMNLSFDATEAELLAHCRATDDETVGQPGAHRLGDVGHAEVGRHTGVAQDAHVGTGVELEFTGESGNEVVAIAQAVGLPGKAGHQLVADRIVGMF